MKKVVIAFPRNSPVENEEYPRKIVIDVAGHDYKRIFR